MSFLLLSLLAGLTYGSRAAALAFLPRPRPSVERVLARIPAPLFAGLATLSLIEPGGGAAPVPVFTAAAGALAPAPRRSLLLSLAGGAAGYAIGTLLAG